MQVLYSLTRHLFTNTHSLQCLTIILSLILSRADRCSGGWNHRGRPGIVNHCGSHRVHGHQGHQEQEGQPKGLNTPQIRQVPHVVS